MDFISPLRLSPLAGLVLLLSCADSGTTGSETGYEVLVPVRLLSEVGVEEAREWPVGRGISLAASEGSLFVGDGINNVVVEFTIDGELVRSVGESGEGPSEIHGLMNVVVGSDDRLYVGDVGGGRVQVFDLADGDFVESLPLRNVGAGFAPWDGGVLGLVVAERYLIAREEAGELIPLEVEGPTLSADVAGVQPAGRPLRYDLAADQSYLYILDTAEAQLWAARQEDGVWTATEMGMPGEAAAEFARIRDLAMESMPPGFAAPSVVGRPHSFRTGEVWVSGLQPAVLGVLIRPEAPNVMIRPSEAEEFRGGWDSALLTADRLAILYEDRLRVYAVENLAARQ